MNTNNGGTEWGNSGKGRGEGGGVREEKIIMRDSDEAAQPYTMAGWRASNGMEELVK